MLNAGIERLSVLIGSHYFLVDNSIDQLKLVVCAKQV